MKQKKQRAQSKKINEDKPLTLGDMLNPELVKGLQGKKNELKKRKKSSLRKNHVEKPKSVNYVRKIKALKSF